MENLTNYAISRLKQSLDKALASSTGEFVPRPKALTLAYAERQRQEQVAQETEARLGLEVARRSAGFQALNPQLSELEVTDLTFQSLSIQSRLEKEGAVYGQSSFNFPLSPIRLARGVMQTITKVALEGLDVIRRSSPVAGSDLNPSEIFLLNNQTKPNGARVDIILTDQGPKIIEANTQWVDGILALQAMQKVFMGQIPKPGPVEILAKLLKSKLPIRLGLINLARGKNSRKEGSAKELDLMAEKLTESGYFSEVETLDPRKIKADYFKNFQAFYINGDPGMISGDTPLWLNIVQNTNKVFPTWNPGYDSKRILIEASQRRPDIFARTEPVDQQVGGFTKGRGFSSSAVALNTEPGKEAYQDSVWQEEQVSIPVPGTFAYDSSSNRPVWLERPYVKFNVWIIGNQAVGIMASLSESKIISDKDFNCVPVPI